MSILVLDATQRLNVHALIGAQRANVDDMRMFWKIQDRIELSLEEKEIIGYQIRQAPNGQQQITWDTSRFLEPREVELTPDEVPKLLKIIKEWQGGFMINADRIWLEPLLGQLENGSGATQQSRIQSGNQ